LQSSWRRRSYRKSRNKLQSWISTDLDSLCLELELGPSICRSYSFECPLVDIHVQSWYVQEGALGYAREICRLAGLSRAAGHESWRRSSAGALLHYASHEQKGSGLNPLLLTTGGIVSGQPVLLWSSQISYGWVTQRLRIRTLFLAAHDHASNVKFSLSKLEGFRSYPRGGNSFRVFELFIIISNACETSNFFADVVLIAPLERKKMKRIQWGWEHNKVYN